MKIVFFASFLSLFIFFASFAQNTETMILMKTDKGNIKLKLYNETPKHKENIIKLVKEKYYNGVLFHRVIKDFMIQTGDPDSKTAKKDAFIGTGGPAYKIPAEINNKFFHKKGALSAARQDDKLNPKKESSGSQFYIVQGKVVSEKEIQQMEDNMNKEFKRQYFNIFLKKPENSILMATVEALKKAKDTKAIDILTAELDKAIGKDYKPIKYPAEKRKAYTTVGGSPFLDGKYTVFGEVIEGLDIIDKVAVVPVDKNKRPVDDIKVISMEIVTK